MDTIQALASTCRVPTAHDKVLNGECCVTFHTPYTTPQGIFVGLSTWMGICPALARNHEELYVRIVKQRRLKELVEGETTAPTKLAIGVEGGFASETEKYETIAMHCIVAVDAAGTVTAELPYNNDTQADFATQVSLAADAVICHAGLTTQQDVQVWQADDDQVPVSKYAADLPFCDNGVKIPPDPSLWKCEKSGDTENVWLNLSDGYMGGGRKHWDGSGGSNGALDHYQETGKLYPLVVKLGTITADLDTADCYSYAADEDGPVKIPNLADLLAKRGIQVANLQKTVKSTAELEVELNANYAFDAITEAGAQLEAVSGAGLQGLQNLGNSCYMNSILQVLIALPEFAKRYGVAAGAPVSSHARLQDLSPTTTPTNLLVQMVKVAASLTSGIFAKPNCQVDDTDPKYRLAPRMFKHVVGKDHVDFCTGQQQDASQFFQYLLERLDRAELGEGMKHVSSHLFSFRTMERMQCSADQLFKYKESAPETVWSLRIPMDLAVVDEEASSHKKDEVQTPDQKRQKANEEEVVKRIALTTCIEEWSKEGIVDDIRWSHLQNAVHPATVQHRFSNFPRYLVLQVQRYTLGPDWQPVKLLVNVDVEESLDLNDFKSAGPKDGEKLVPDEPEKGEKVAKPTPLDEMALAQLMDMGFSLNSCKRALTAVGGNNVEAAMGWVFEHNTDPDFNDPLTEDGGDGVAAGDSSGVDESVVQSLVSNLGMFSADQVRAALKETNGASDRAADWLFSHMDDLDGAIAALEGKDTKASASAPKVPLSDGNGKYLLKAMVSHIGKHTGSGHYVAHVKKDGKWVIFNDEKVALSSEPPFPHAYLYIYERADSVGSPDENY